MVLGATREEIQVANIVRRAIQKARLAKPETLEGLEKEVRTALDEHLGRLGSLYETVEAEVEKGLSLARKRAASIKEARSKEEAVTKVPKELIDGMAAKYEEFQAKIKNVMDEIPEEDALKDLSADDPFDTTVPRTKAAVEELESEATKFQKEVADFAQANLQLIKDPKLPGHISQSWLQLRGKMDAQLREVTTKMKAAKDAVRKITAEASALKFEEAKKTISEQIKESSGAAVKELETAISGLEKKSEQFNKTKGQDEEEKDKLAAELEEMINACKESVTTARALIEPTDEALKELDEDLKKELQAFAAAEAKKPGVRIGQMEKRLQRVQNFVTTYRDGKQKREFQKKVDSIKPEVLEKVKAFVESEKPFADLEDAVVQAEKTVDSLRKLKKASDMGAAIGGLADAVEAATLARDKAQAALFPIPKDIDEAVKEELLVCIGKECDMKKHKFTLGKISRRIVRVTNLLETFRQFIERKKLDSAKETRAVVKQVLDQIRKSSGENGQLLDTSELFSKIDVGSVGSIDKEKFLAFFAKLGDSKSGLHKGGIKLPEGVKINTPTAEELACAFGSLCENGSETLSKEAFTSFATMYMKVKKGVSLQDGNMIGESKTKRVLKVDTVVEVMGNPIKDEKIGVERIKVKCKDGVEGWASVAGNAGTIYLVPC